MSFQALIHKEVTIPDDADVYFVGDLHGCYDLYRTALKLAGFRHGHDHIVCVGDLADRGDKSLECMAEFIFNKPRSHSVMGNHDMFLATAKVRSESAGLLIYNGGHWALDLNPDTVDALSENILKNIPIFLTVHHRGKKYGIVHAEIPVQYMDVGDKFIPVDWDETIHMIEDFGKRQKFAGPYWRAIDPYIWGRDVLGYHENTTQDIPVVGGVDYTLHGHTVRKEPVMVKNRFYIDTGGVYNGALTVARALPEGGFETITTDAYAENGIWRQYI